MNLKELSKSLGLSPATVSRALGGYPEVNAKTRQRVEEAAKRHNYHPNMRARSLATGRSFAAGHVIPISTQHEMVNPIFADFIAGAGEVYSAHGYDMMLSVVSDENEERAYRDLAAKRSVDGVIVHGPQLNDNRIGLLKEIGLPFVVHGRANYPDNTYSWVDVNNRSAFRRATDFLLDLGHQRIALLNGNEQMMFAYRRRIGYEEALAARSVALDPALLRSDEMTEPYGFAAVSELLDLPNPPTAFLTASIIAAIGARRAVQERGLVLGRDISIITHDDELSYLSDSGDVPMFTSTRSSVREAGSICAKFLLDVIRNPDAAPRGDLLEAQLVVGASTGIAPSS